MRKIMAAASLAAVICFFGSCSLFFNRGVIYDDSGTRANKKFEEIIEIIKDQDKEALKALFSEKGIEDADDFDGNLDRLFEFIQGEIESWEQSSGPGSTGSKAYGWEEIYSYFYVTTDAQKYYFLVYDCTVDDTHSDNVGLYMLLVVKAEYREAIYDGDNKIIYDGDTKLSHAGIYLPIE